MIGRTDAEQREIETRAAASGDPAFRLDASAGTLWRGMEPILLRPKTLGVLEFLIERDGAVVGPDELRDRVWGRRHGNENGPKQCIRELRRLFGDSLGAPRFIETVGRLGYRFIGDIGLIGPKVAGQAADADHATSGPLFAGRKAEIARLTRALDAARRGARSVVMISGEAGAGKTRLIDAFEDGLGRTDTLWTARGQCIPVGGAREPYGPIFEALQQLAQSDPAGLGAGPILRDAAPWGAPYLQGFLPDTELEERRVERAGSAPERSLRELIAVFERLSLKTPGMLILEDLHWADPSTLDWLRGWSLRRAPAHLLVIGTCRSEAACAPLTEAMADLGRNLAFHALKIGGLDADAIAEIFDGRFPGHALPRSLCDDLVRRTEGHAILVAGVIEDWAIRGLIRSDGAGWTVAGRPEALLEAAPAAVQTFIARQIDLLTPDARALLDAASVAGLAFSAASLSEDAEGIEAIEADCETLARQGIFIEAAGPIHWPDGTVSSGYRFRHSLYRDALHDGIPAATRRGLHRRIGNRLEAAFGNSAGKIAPLLADHFENAGDPPRAVLYRRRSGEEAFARGAAREAVGQLRLALALNAETPVSDARDAAEIETLMSLGAALISSDGFADPALPDLYTRVNALSQNVSDPAILIPMLCGLWNFHLTRADFSSAIRLAGSLESLADAPGTDAALGMAARNAVGITLWLAGEPAKALTHIDAVVATYDQKLHGGLSARFGEDPGIVCRHYATVVAQLLDRPDEAERHFEAGMDIARSLKQPFGAAQMLWAGAVAARERGETPIVRDRARQLVETCETGETTFWLPGGQILAGWAACAEGDPSGLTDIETAKSTWRNAGIALTRPYNLGLAASAHARIGQPSEARATLDRALGLCRETGELWCEPSLRRLSEEIDAASR